VFLLDKMPAKYIKIGFATNQHKVIGLIVI